jgi:hypothetical protein
MHLKAAPLRCPIAKNTNSKVSGMYTCHSFTQYSQSFRPGCRYRSRNYKLLCLCHARRPVSSRTQEVHGQHPLSSCSPAWRTSCWSACHLASSCELDKQIFFFLMSLLYLSVCSLRLFGITRLMRSAGIETLGGIMTKLISCNRHTT